jgi:hypothetical protein
MSGLELRGTTAYGWPDGNCLPSRHNHRDLEQASARWLAECLAQDDGSTAKLPTANGSDRLSGTQVKQ